MTSPKICHILLTFSSKVISAKMIGPGISGSMPSHSGTSSLSSARNECPICLHKSSMHYRASNPGPRPFIFVEITIELDVTNLSREGLVMSSSMAISIKMIGPGISGSMPSHPGTSPLSTARIEPWTSSVRLCRNDH